jgi:hypothetical protein
LRDDPPDICWQRLETVLSVWIEMIERGKVVALHKTMAARDGEDSSPDTDVRRCASNALWGWLPYSKIDLEETLQAWRELIQAINDRRPGPHPVFSLVPKGLFEEDVLRSAGVREGGFAWRFYTNAQKPDFQYLGPGLAVPSPEQLTAQPPPFKFGHKGPNDPPTRPGISPLAILVGERRAKTWVFDNGDQFDPNISWGLHLDHYHEPQTLSPFEDGCVLALPYDPHQAAEKLNGAPTSESTELYQIGWNSFMPKHSTQLLSVLRQFTLHVTSGLWRVGCAGVDEPDAKFADIDWEEKWYQYGDEHLEVLAHVVEGIFDGAWQMSADEP